MKKMGKEHVQNEINVLKRVEENNLHFLLKYGNKRTTIRQLDDQQRQSFKIDLIFLPAIIT